MQIPTCLPNCNGARLVSIPGALCQNDELGNNCSVEVAQGVEFPRYKWKLVISVAVLEYLIELI